MAFVFVYAGTRQPLPAGTRVYGLELGEDKLPAGEPFKSEIVDKGRPGTFMGLGHPPGLHGNDPAAFAPEKGTKYQVIAIPKAQDFETPAEAYQALRRCPPLAFEDGRLGAVMLPGLRADQRTPPHAGGYAVRFRATAKDGEEIVSSAISLGDAGAGPRLALARFGEVEARCGVTASLRVFVRGLEGASVRFEIESGDGSAWKPAGTATAEVKGGEAVAQFPVPPALLPDPKSADEAKKPGAKLRARAVLEEEKLLSAAVPLFPPPFVPPPAPARPAPAASKPAPAPAPKKAPPPAPGTKAPR